MARSAGSLPGRQIPSPVGPYIADFLSFRHKLVIEVDGGQHSAEGDARRTAYLNREGYRVVRFWNNEVLENCDGVLQSVVSFLTGNDGYDR